jgi:hypothetical protein
VVKSERLCGFCNDTFHDKCPHEIAWFDKLWICGCSCNAGWEAKDVVVARKTKTDP